MATIGLDKLYYATITEGAGGAETYGAPTSLAAAISADLTVDITDAPLYADDGALYRKREFKSGKIALNVADIGASVAAALTNGVVDTNGVLMSRAGDAPKPVAIGFRTQGADGKRRYYWLYRVTFAVPGLSAQTKSDTINYATPTIEGTFICRNKADPSGLKPWKTEYIETGEGDATALAWFTSVYEPSYT